MRRGGRIGAAVLALLAAACTSHGAAVRSAAGHGPGGTALAAFSASQDFYRLPTHVPAEPPGTLYRIQPVASSNGSMTLRVMYHSEDANGHDALVTGLVTYPVGAAPAGGWPVVSWDHGTTGLSQSCAPSRAGGVAPGFGVRGVAVATDYLGLGPDGEIHPYINRVTEARATIDIVRAVRDIPDAHANATWVVIGDSQGGHAALATGEIAPGYAPDLHLVGTVAIAPASELTKVFPADNPIVIDSVTVMGIFGAQAADPRVKPDDYLSPAAQGVASVIASGCDMQVAAFLLDVYLKTGTVFSTPPLDTAEGLSYMQANDVGHVRTQSPVLVIGGGEDTIVVPDRINALMDDLCAAHDRVLLDWLPTGNHSTEPGMATADIAAWTDARLAGKTAPTSCPFDAQSAESAGQ